MTPTSVTLDDGSCASRAIDAVWAHHSSLSSSLLAHFLVVRIAKETLEALDAVSYTHLTLPTTPYV